MITHEIKKPEPAYAPRSIIQQAKDTARALAGRMGGGAPDRRLENVSWYQGPGGRFMDKIPYTQWLEGEVRPRFPRGSLCTIAAISPDPTKIPTPVFVVDELQEVCWMAAIDNEQGQPRCVGVKNKNIHTAQIWYPPALLRPLTVEEVALVHIRDNETQPSENDSSYAG